MTLGPCENESPSSSPPAAATAINRNAEKYQRILDAAVAVFAEKGFFTSRISDIADRANVADGTVYLYFKNKEEILMTAINTAFDAFMRQARTELEKMPTRPNVCAGWPSCISTRWARTAIWPWSSRWSCGRARVFCPSSRIITWSST